MALGKGEAERLKVLRELRKDTGTGKAVMSDSERLELSALQAKEGTGDKPKSGGAGVGGK